MPVYFPSVRCNFCVESCHFQMALLLLKTVLRMLKTLTFKLIVFQFPERVSDVSQEKKSILQDKFIEVFVGILGAKFYEKRSVKKSAVILWARFTGNQLFLHFNIIF